MFGIIASVLGWAIVGICCLVGPMLLLNNMSEEDEGAFMVGLLTTGFGFLCIGIYAWKHWY